MERVYIPTDKLNGTLIPGVEVGSCDVYYYSDGIDCFWNATELGSYHFTLVIEFNSSASEPVEVGDHFLIQLIDLQSNSYIADGWPAVFAVATAYTTAIPELATVGLMGIGLIAILALRRRM